MPSQKQAAGTPETDAEVKRMFASKFNMVEIIDGLEAKARQLETRLRSLEGRNEELGKALQEIADESQQHAEYNSVSGVTRLPKGYTKIMNMACDALAPAPTKESP